jgi:hypothetical protein
MTVPTAANDTSPALLSEAFAAGETFEGFRDGLPADSPGRIDLEKPVLLAGAELAFHSVTDLRVLAIVEDWCKDSRDALPVLDALIRTSPRSELRVIRRDDHPDVMKGYLKDGRFAAVPVFIFLDADFRELARYVERPVSVTRLRRSEREDLTRRDPRFAPSDAKPSAFEEPIRSDLKAAVLAARSLSQPSASVLIAAELAAIADGIADIQAGRAPAPTPFVAASEPVPSTLTGLAQRGPIEILDVGDDDCEIEENS